MKIDIVGGGPAGLISGLVLSDDHEVTVYEQQERIKSTPCTESVSSWSLDRLRNLTEFGSKEYVKSELEGLKIIFPKDNVGVLRGKGYILDRDEWLRDMASELEGERGQEIELNRKIEDVSELKGDVIVGADGPWSVVRDHIGGEAEIREVHQKKVESEPPRGPWACFYVDKDLAPYYSWIFPNEPGTVTVGSTSEEAVEKLIEKEDVHGKIVEEVNWADSTKGTVYEKDSIYLIGDAASTSNVYTAGGVGPIIEASSILKETIGNGEAYGKEIRERLVTEDDYKGRRELEDMSNEELEWLGEVVDGEDILNLPLTKKAENPQKAITYAECENPPKGIQEGIRPVVSDRKIKDHLLKS